MSFDDDLTTPILYTEDDHENHVENPQTSTDDELRIENAFSRGFCNPSSAGHRFFALLLMCLMGFAGSFCYGTPGALQNYFTKDLDMSMTEYIWMGSISSWPNVVICFVGGFLVDRVFGIRFGTILYVFVLMIGQLIFAFGVILNAFWMILFGRFVFGIGAGSLTVAQRSYAVLWFKDKELNMVFGVMASFGLIGITINFWVMEPLYKYINQWYTGHTCLGVVMLISFTTCLMSFVCAVVLGVLDKRAQRILQRSDNPSGEIAKLSDVKTFKATFWMLTAIVIACDMAFFPFMTLSKMFFMLKYEFSAQDANYINSMIFIAVAVASPLFGYTIDKTGKNIYWMLMSILALITAHLLFAFTFFSPFVCMISMGLAYLMLCSNLMPLIAYTVSAHQLGTAYGTSSAVGHLILAVVSMFIGKIVDYGGYFSLEIFFICWLGVALTGTIILCIDNEIKNGILNMSPHERELHLAKK